MRCRHMAADSKTEKTLGHNLTIVKYTCCTRVSRVPLSVKHCIGPNRPGIYGTVTDFFGPFRIPDSFIIFPEMEERRTIKPLVAQMLASLGVYEGIICLAASPKRFCGNQFTR